MSESDADKWDRRYRETENVQPRPAFVLSEYAHLLPARGDALELAAGLGGNALFLARLGFNVTAWDISAQAMKRLAGQAAAEGVPLHYEVRDVVAEPPPPERFDVIVVSRFLERTLCPAITAALRPGGLLFYQTFTREKVETGAGPSNPDFLLQRNELLHLFPDLVVRLYREEGVLGDTAIGLRNETCLVAEKI